MKSDKNKVGGSGFGKVPSGLTIIAALDKKKEGMSKSMDDEMDSLNPEKMLKKAMTMEDGSERDGVLDELIDHLQAMKSDISEEKMDKEDVEEMDA